MGGTTWTKFYWADWESDPALRLCSIAAQGLWMRMLCIAAAHDPIGYVSVAGRGLSETDLARMTGVAESEVIILLGELDRNGVFSRDRHGRIYSRRMVSDEKKSANARRNGKNGGNPTLRNYKENSPSVKGSDKGGLKGEVKPHKPIANSQIPEDASLRSASAPRGRPELDELERRCREAADLVNEASPALLDLSPIVTLLDRGWDLETDLLPILRAAAARGKRGRTWSYYVPAIEDSRARNATIAAKPHKPSITPDDGWRNKVRQYLETGFWLADWGGPPGGRHCEVPKAILAEFETQLAAMQDRDRK